MRKLNLDSEDLRHYGKVFVVVGLVLVVASVVAGGVGYLYFDALHHPVR